MSAPPLSTKQSAVAAFIEVRRGNTLAIVGSPNAHPYAIIDHALKDVKRRSATIVNAARVVPWYQDFTLGPPRYGATEVRAQINAGYANGVTSWVLWNPGSRYSVGALEPERR